MGCQASRRDGFAVELILVMKNKFKEDFVEGVSVFYWPAITAGKNLTWFQVHMPSILTVGG